MLDTFAYGNTESLDSHLRGAKLKAEVTETPMWLFCSTNKVPSVGGKGPSKKIDKQQSPHEVRFDNQKVGRCTGLTAELLASGWISHVNS